MDNGSAHEQQTFARRSRLVLLSAVCTVIVACTSPQFSSPEAPDSGAGPSCSGNACAAPPVEAGAKLGGDASREVPDDAAVGKAGADGGPATPPGSDPPNDASAAGSGNDAGGASADPALVGTYAIRMRYHGVESSGLSKFAQEIVTLGEIALDPSTGKHVLSLKKWCQDRATNSTATGTIDASLWQPQAYPVRVYQLQVTGDSFSTTGPAVNAGYVAHSPSACSPGAQIPRQEGQVWLTGNCTCPKGDAMAAPTVQDDCRVTDSDGDGHPGFTVTWTGQLNGDNYFARRDLSQLSFGKIDRANRKHSAQYVLNHEHKQLNCSGTCTPPPGYRPCADTSVNTVLFEPVADGYDCAAVSADVAEGKLFTPDPLANVQGC